MEKFPPRIRFNWGYHSGASDVLNKRKIKNVSNHFDSIYAQGYEYGVEDAYDGVYSEDSTEAWKSRVPLRTAPWMPKRIKR